MRLLKNVRERVGVECCLYFGLMFLFLMVFYTQVHPFVLYTGDDWVNVSLSRQAVPIWHGHNPAKVLPETLFPAVGLLSAYVVYPLVGDYILSVTIATALVMSILVVVYHGLFFRLLRARYKLDDVQGICLSAVFFMAHFLLLKKLPLGNSYLYGSHDLTCVYNYLIPALWNFCLVFYFWNKDLASCEWKKHKFRAGMLLFTIYLGIFSNVLNSIIFIAFLVGRLFLESAFWRLLRQGHFVQIVRENKVALAIVVVWLISLFFEANGGRARGIGASIWHLPIRLACMKLLDSFKAIGGLYIAFSMVAYVACAYVWGKNRTWEFVQRYWQDLCVLACSAVVSSVYLILVGAKANPTYLPRVDVAMALYVLLIMTAVFALAVCLKRYEHLIVVFPVALLIFAVATADGAKAFREGQGWGIPQSTAAAVSRDLMRQIQAAEAEGKKEMTLHAPTGNSIDNWPHPMYMGRNISNTLFRHGLISQPIKIKIQPDEAMRIKYHLPKLR